MSSNGARIRVPKHVVARAFDTETIVLNLHTGEYHGLNPTAARMFDLLRQHGSISAVASVVANELGQPVDEVAHDVEHLCADLAWRDLLEIDGAKDG
jgi:Coenzyme PQQ synthesis protein D (PqqD)